MSAAPLETPPPEIAAPPDVAPIDPQSRRSVRAIMGVGKFYAQVFHELRVLSPCRLPRTGPAILVCNHTSSLDPVLIQSACPRMIIWMMAKEYYEIAWLKWGFELIDSIPVSRSGKDLAATRAALRALEHGQILGVFPEGRIEPDRNLLPFHTGVAMMAKRSAVPVFPAYLDGSQRNAGMAGVFSQSRRATLAFGPAIQTGLSDVRSPRASSDLAAATAIIRSEVEHLKQITLSQHVIG